MDTGINTRYFYNLFKDLDWAENISVLLNMAINLLIVGILAYILNKVLKKILHQFLERLSRRTTTKFDDFLFQNKTVSHFTHLIVLIFFRWLLPKVFVDFEFLHKEAILLLDIAFVVVLIWLIRSVLFTFKDFLKSLQSFKDKPIESYVQVFMIITWFLGIIIIFSILTHKSIWQFLTALGALSAIILLIFKDTILGFVASIQVSVNDTVRIGDWITMEKYNADGDVVEINLASVKVRNFDNTITTIPTYYLISDSFKNWRGMNMSSGRRIKRSVIIKTGTIRFLAEDEVEELKKIELIREYLTTRQGEIKTSNSKKNIDKNLLINGRNLTNFGVFRKYIENYLAQHPAINKDMMFMSRQLAQTPEGIPLEVYAFSSDKVWKNYEYIVGDIFDHLLAAIPYFRLEGFESPTGSDWRKLEAFEDENFTKKD